MYVYNPSPLLTVWSPFLHLVFFSYNWIYPKCQPVRQQPGHGGNGLLSQWECGGESDTAWSCPARPPTHADTCLRRKKRSPKLPGHQNWSHHWGRGTSQVTQSQRLESQYGLDLIFHEFIISYSFTLRPQFLPPNSSATLWLHLKLESAELIQPAR